MLVPKFYARFSVSTSASLKRSLAVFYSTHSHDKLEAKNLTKEEDQVDERKEDEKSQGFANNYCRPFEQTSNTRGKKLRPTKPNIVVLDHRQSGLLRKRDTPSFFAARSTDDRLSVLEGVELGGDSDWSRRIDAKNVARGVDPLESNSNEIFREIESQRRKLLIFKSRVSKEQALRSIDYQKPSTTVLSKKRYEQLKQLLDSAYTVSQLKAYVKKCCNSSASKINKSQVVALIMNECWKCSINDSIDESEDLILERIIDVNIRDMYLLLLTNNGKILNNFARMGATVAVALDENIVIVRGTAPIIRYVEVSLNKILANVSTANLPIKDIILNHTERGSLQSLNTEELISLVQRESAVYFERLPTENEDSGSLYSLSAFGSKRMFKAENLLLWGVRYQPQLVEDVALCSDKKSSQFRRFPFTNVECLNWIDKSKEWYRLQLPFNKVPLNAPKKATDLKLQLNNSDLDRWYDFLANENSNLRMMKLNTKKTPSHIFSMTLGQVLTPFGDAATDKIFEPKITQVTSKLLELPLYDSLSSKDELFTVDQHEYYVQLKFIPDLSTVDNSTENAPPLELWFELDDYDNSITGSLRCLLKLTQRSLLLRTPHLEHDYRISADTIAELTDVFEEDQENWLSEQPGIKNFLQESQLNFDSRKKLIIPKSVSVVLPRENLKGEAAPLSLKYDYVNASYHRVLRLLYMDKYLVQFSDVKCGSLGGRFTQVDFIGGESLNREDFKKFVHDVSRTF